MGRKFGFSFSWKRALGISAFKGKVSKLIRIPLTKTGRERKVGRLVGDLAGSALIAATQAASDSTSNSPISTLTDTTPWREIVSDSGFVSQELVDYKHGAKILVQYFPSDNKTTVFHDIPSIDHSKRQPFTPDLIVDGNVANGTHTFAFHDSVAFPGFPPKVDPTDTSWWWIHKIVSAEQWHFPPNCELLIDADGNRLPVKVAHQFELKRESANDAELTETLIAVPTFETYKTIASANAVVARVGSASFTLDGDILASYRNFVGYLTPRP
jgi:hypothetical protein